MLAQPAQGMVHHLPSPPFNALVTILATLALVKERVVDVEAARKTGRAHGRIENRCPDEGGRVITVAVQELRKVGDVFPQPGAQIAHVVELRVGTSKDGCMGGGS